MYTIKQMGIETYFVGEYGKMYSDIFSKNFFYEQIFLDYIRSLGLKGVYLDIGGNIGNHALYFANFCKSKLVYTFEPLDRYQKYIEENLKINGLQGKVFLEPYALSDSSEPVSFEMGGHSQVISNLMRLDDCELALDELCMIKIDVEGNEEKVINGAMKTIIKYKPNLYIEVFDNKRLLRIDEKLNRIGYGRTTNVFNGSPTHEWVFL